MAKEATVAPKERVNIVYRPATGDAKEEIELPLKVLVMGDFTNRKEDLVLEEREPINIDKDNFNEVIKSMNLETSYSVSDKLSGEQGTEMSVKLKFESLKDFNPENVAQQVPEMERLLQLREALTALKGPLSNRPAFQKKLSELVRDEETKQLLIKELGME
jgi:type VI secretion system protein ImpB